MKLDEGCRIEAGVSMRYPGTIYLAHPGGSVYLTKEELWQFVDALLELGDMLEVRG